MYSNLYNILQIHKDLMVRYLGKGKRLKNDRLKTMMRSIVIPQSPMKTTPKNPLSIFHEVIF